MSTLRTASMPRVALSLLLLGALTPGAAHAGEFTFHVDPAVFEVLETNVDSDTDLTFRDPGSQAQSAKFFEYRDLHSGFRLQDLRVWADDAETSRHFQLTGTNVGRDDARMGVEYGIWGDWSVGVDYNKIVHNFGNDGVFLWNITAPGHFEIAQPTRLNIQQQIERQFATSPAGVNYAFLRNLLTPYLASANSIDVGLQRDRTEVNFDLGRMKAIGWTLQIQHENREGTRPYGGSFGFSNAPEIVEPIDYRTDSAELRGEINHKNSGAQFGVRYSKFKNDISTLYWDNEFRATDATDASAYSAPGAGSIGGAATGFADLAPDNEMGLAYFNGRAKFDNGWWTNGRASYQNLRQDDPLLPYTLNRAISRTSNPAAPFDPTNRANLPRQNADEKVGITDLAVAAGTHLGDRMSLAFRYKYYDYDNKSPRIEFPGYVRFHAVWEAIERITVPYSYTSQNASAELGWEVTSKSNLLLALLSRSMHRDFAETTRTNENALRLSYDTSAIENFVLRAAVEHGDRNISGEYDNERGGGASFPEPESTNLPGMRKFNQAERGYDLWNAQADWSIGDRLSLSGQTQGRHDDYDKSDFGLTDSKLLTFGAELGYAINATSNFIVFYNRDVLDYDLDSRQSGATPSVNPLDNWSAAFTDATDTLGIGWNCTNCRKWTIDLSGRYSKTDGKADFFSPPGGSPDVAFDIGNYDDVRLWSIEGTFDYPLTEHLSAGAYFLWEDYDINSFRTKGVDPFLPGSPLLDLVNGPYQANVLGARLRFGI